MTSEQSAKETSNFGSSIPKENSSSPWKKLPIYKYKPLEVKLALDTISQAPTVLSPKIFTDIIYSKINEAILEFNEQVLKDLYKTLDNLHKECEEENFPLFSEIARKNTRRILKFIHNNFPDNEYHIYPTEDQEIAICCSPQIGKRILILCDSKGSIACFATFKGKNRRFRYSSMEDSFYKLLRETFKELEKYSLKPYSIRSVSSFSNSKDSENKTWKTNENIFSILEKNSFDDTYSYA